MAQGNEAYLAKQLEEALKHYSDAIKLVPENLVYRLNRAATLVELERFDQAVSECKRVISSGKRGRWCFSRPLPNVINLTHSNCRNTTLLPPARKLQHKYGSDSTR